MSSEIYIKISEIAKQKGISLYKLARLAGIPYNTLYAAIRRNSSLTVDMANRLSDALNISVYDLAGIYSEADELRLRIEELEAENYELKISIKTLTNLVGD